MKTKDQIINKDYAIYNSDCMEVLPTLPDNSVDMSVYSPPFAGLYNYRLQALRDQRPQGVGEDRKGRRYRPG